MAERLASIVLGQGSMSNVDAWLRSLEEAGWQFRSPLSGEILRNDSDHGPIAIELDEIRTSMPRGVLMWRNTGETITCFIRSSRDHTELGLLMDGTTLLQRLELGAALLSFFYGCAAKRLFVFDPEGLTEDVNWLDVADCGSSAAVPILPPGRGVIIVSDEALAATMPGHRLADPEHPGLVEIW